MKLTAKDLLSLGVIDKVIKEPLGGAHKDKDLAAKNIKKYILQELKVLMELEKEELILKRYEKFRSIF